MRFTSQGSMAAVAMAASLASATAVSERTLGLDLSKDAVSVDLGVDLTGKVLVAGAVADVAVDTLAHVAADAEVAVTCLDCHVNGNIDASLSLDHVVPALKLELSDIEAMLDLDVKIDAGATIAINLNTPDVKISLPLAGLNVEANVYLDLILGVEAALDLSAGVYVKLADKASISTDIFSGDILDTDFSGLAVKVLPIEVRIGCTELLADLRVRVELGVSAAVDVDDILPLDEILGIDIPEIGAGLDLAVFVNLMEYVGLFCAGDAACPLSKESYGLNVGAAVELDVDVENLLALDLAPTVSIGLLQIPTTTLCQPTYTATTKAVPAMGSGYATGSPAYPTSSAAPVTAAYPTGSDMVTSTISSTQTYTVTACAANVANCPAGYGTQKTVIHTTMYTTVCPATMTGSVTAAPVPTATGSHDITTITKHVTTMVPCSGNGATSTFTPPASQPTAPYATTHPVATTTAATSAVTYPAGSATTAVTPSIKYPATSAATSATYPAGGASSVTYPAGGASSSHPAAGTPSSPAGYPMTSSVVPYPTGNGTVPTMMTTYKPSASSTYPVMSSTSYPSSPAATTPVQAGAGKVGSGFAGVFAVVGAVVALM